MTLDELGLKHGTDKASNHHDYLDYYDSLFWYKRNEPIMMLEMGTADNKSLRMWAEYFRHPETRIYGLEIDPGYADPALPRVTRIIGSQTDQGALSQVPSLLDLVVDDAGHFTAQIITAFDAVFPVMKSGGLWIIEDLCGPGYNPEYIREGWENGRSIMDYLYNTIDTINGRNKTECGKVVSGNSWQENMIDTITFRKGLCMIKRR